MPAASSAIQSRSLSERTFSTVHHSCGSLCDAASSDSSVSQHFPWVKCFHSGDLFFFGLPHSGSRPSCVQHQIYKFAHPTAKSPFLDNFHLCALFIQRVVMPTPTLCCPDISKSQASRSLRQHLPFFSGKKSILNFVRATTT